MTASNLIICGQTPVAELKKMASGRWAEIFEALAKKELNDAIQSAPFHVPCPVHGGENGFRFFEHFNETGRGICNTCGPLKNGFHALSWAKKISIEQATSEVEQWLLKDQAHPAPIRPKSVYVPKPKVDPAKAYELIAKVWKASTPIKGTVAEKYLINRGIWPENISNVLRAHPGLPYTYGKERTYLGTFPCLLAPIKDKDNKLVSVHRIFLDESGQKANVPDAKKMMSQCGEIRGAAIKLFSPTEKVLGLAEGIETALAAYAGSRMPVWSCVFATLMELVDIPDNVEHVVIWADLDISERGIQAAESLADRLEKLGKTVEICIPQGPIPRNKKGIDWLDVLINQGLNGFPAKWRKWRPAMTPESVANYLNK